MDEAMRDKVFLQAAGCMENLVGGSGHLTSYTMDPASFVITGTRDLGGGLTEYAFSALATAVSEFMDVAEDELADVVDEPVDVVDDPDMVPVQWASPAGPSRVSATLVLDAAGNLALDENGNVRLGGYRCLSPAFWHPDHKPR